MTNPNSAAQAANENPLSDEYVNAIIQRYGYDSPESVIAQLHQWIGLHGGEDTVTLLMYEAHKALCKLRAPKPLGDRCHHCGWMDWVSHDGAAHCQACGKPHGSVPAEGLPNLPQLLRENADLDAAEGGNPDVVALEWAAADEIERLRREVSKLRAPVADERAALRRALEGMLAVFACGAPQGESPTIDAARAALASAPVAGEPHGDSHVGLEAPVAVETRPVAWRYQTPTGWHATTDAQKAVSLRAHHPVEPLYPKPQARECECSRKSKAVSDSEAQL